MPRQMHGLMSDLMHATVSGGRSNFVSVQRARTLSFMRVQSQWEGPTCRSCISNNYTMEQLHAFVPQAVVLGGG